MNINRNILQINTAFHGVFQTKPMIAFKGNKNFQEIIGGRIAKQGKIFKKGLHRLNGKPMRCCLTSPSLCFAQIVNTQTFMSHQTKKTFTIFHKLTRKSQYGMHIMQNPVNWKIRDTFNLKLNNHRKDGNNSEAITECHHFKNILS